jgi:hypothetical protein
MKRVASLLANYFLQEATYCSQTSVDFQRTTGQYVSEDRTLHNHLCEKLIKVLHDCYNRIPVTKSNLK